jgi:hypothetical protein
MPLSVTVTAVAYAMHPKFEFPVASLMPDARCWQFGLGLRLLLVAERATSRLTTFLSTQPESLISGLSSPFPLTNSKQHNPGGTGQQSKLQLGVVCIVNSALLSQCHMQDHKA